MNRFGYLGCLNIYIIKIRLISVFGFQGTNIKFAYAHFLLKNLASLDSSQPFSDCDYNGVVSGLKWTLPPRRRLYFLSLWA